MNKKIVNLEFLLNEEKKSALIILLTFSIVGIGITISTFLQMVFDFSTNNLITFLVLTTLFGIPFGYFIGLKRVIYLIRKKQLIKNGDIFIYIDKITDKQRLGNTTDTQDKKEYQITLKDYSAKTRKNACLKTLKEFNASNVGSNCILVFTKLSTRPFNVLPGDLYELDNQLLSRCITNLDRIIK